MAERKIDPKFNIYETYTTMNVMNPYRFGGGSAGYEPETVALMASIGWADDATVSPHNGLTYKGVYDAVDTYFKAGKTAGYLALLKAVYLFIGNTADNHKWNAMNPQDTDAAFRMLWTGGLFSANGYKGSGVSYGNTNFAENNNTLGSQSYGVYSRTEIAANYIDMGASAKSVMYVRWGTNLFYTSCQSPISTNSNTTSLGMFGATRQDNFYYKKFANTTFTDVSADITGGSTDNFWLGSRAYSPGYYSQREYCYFFIGDGLTQAQMTDHIAAVQQLQTDLGRQV
jgi:hypothetical protein